MKTDPCSIATDLAARMSKCSTIIELRALGLEIKANLAGVAGFEDWLRDWYTSRAITLSAPDKPFEDTLNAKGKKKYLKGESLE